MRRVVVVTLSLLFAVVAAAQNSRTVIGFVLNSEGDPIIGATVKAVGEDVVTKTGQGGKFEMQVSQYCNYIEASEIGFVTQKREVDGSKIIIRLKVDRKYYRKIRVAERRKLYAVPQSGLNHMVGIQGKVGFAGAYSSLGATYTIGYRFNNLFFLGGGTGLMGNFGAKASERYIKEDGKYNSKLNPYAISIPIYAYFHANLIDRRWSPYLALAAGGNFSPKQTLHLNLVDVKYPTNCVFANPQVGVNFRTTTKTSLSFAVGFQCFSTPLCIDYKAYNATIKPGFGCGIDFHLGFTF